MTVPTEKITATRLADWRQDCDRDHATPVLLVAIGHDDHAGEMHIYVPEDIPADWFTEWLRAALEQLSGCNVLLARRGGARVRR